MKFSWRLVCGWPGKDVHAIRHHTEAYRSRQSRMAPEPAIKWAWLGVRLSRILPPRVLSANGLGPSMVADRDTFLRASAAQVVIELLVDGRPASADDDEDEWLISHITSCRTFYPLPVLPVV
jgi:hypothetical protein